MVVPYGDPAHPHPRKFAFDVGEYVSHAKSRQAAELMTFTGSRHPRQRIVARMRLQGESDIGGTGETLPDTFWQGVIHYLPGAFVNHAGRPEVIEKAICIHEEDGGLLWKHSGEHAERKGFEPSD